MTHSSSRPPRSWSFRSAALLASLLACAGQALAPLPALAQPAAAAEPASELYPGTVLLEVDATDLDHRIVRVRQTLPVRTGPLRMFFPRWVPGHHAPTGDVSRVAGLKISAPDRVLPWARDPLDTHAFRLTVPSGVSTIGIEFQFITPVRGNARVVMTRELLNLQWHNLVLYPAGYELRSISVQPSLRLPPDWQYGSALRAASVEQGLVQFRPVSMETLVDSPVFAGRHFRRYELDAANAPRPVTLNVFADRAELIAPTDAQVDAHRHLVQQADKLFGARHFTRYEFLLALSDELGGIGLEHHESSENVVRTRYLENWDRRAGGRDLLPHEYVHSWNGKFRRPRELATPHLNTPMQDSLLWLYEGQTQYWGWVLAARSALWNAEVARDNLAKVAAAAENRSGRAWRSLQDTTHEPLIGNRNWERDWRDWQRGADYYDEAALVWLDADTLIREKSGNQRSLDDFARAFFGVNDGELGPLTYTFEDVVKALNEVQAHDWARFLRDRLDATGSARAPLDGLARGGWRLTYVDTPGENHKAEEAEHKFDDFTWSLGLRVGAEGRLAHVQWDSPAFRAGMSPAMTLVAVNWRAYKSDVLKDAIKANLGGKAPIDLLLREGESFRAVRIDYRGGLRYPRLERVPNTEDRLAAVLAPR